jgi:glycine/D-amino acid oxidase-like deaminating enzyme/nitrite reductase/ring-hydroxylating ferredoxin subunit
MPSGDAGTDSERESVWIETADTPRYDPLDGDRRVETAVVGAGIVGATVAYELTEAGQSVALLERDRVLRGVTGHTTAKLTAQHGLLYDYLLETFDQERTQQYATANAWAIDEVERRVDELAVDCDFERVPSYVYSRSATDREDYRAEADAAARLGFSAEYTESLPDAFDAAAAVRFDEQARFHPRKYLRALVAGVAQAGGHVFEQTPVTDVNPGRPCALTTDRGTVTADNVVLATHFPIYDKALYFARLYPKQSYVLAVELRSESPTGLFYRPGDRYFSVRPAPVGDASSVLVGGQNHRTGHGGDTASRYQRLEAAAREHFDVAAVTHRWSTQDFVSVDRVPFVGRHSPLRDSVYVATGFGGWGLTNGTAAAVLLADLVLGRQPRWREVYRPTRRPVGASLAPLLDHGKHAASHAVRDRLTSPAAPSTVRLGRGAGAVVEGSDGPVAVSRDESGKLHAVSAVCTHQGCHVTWNGAERTWECPCHGSRFDVDGTVIDTPAVDGLQSRSPPDVD